MYAHLTIAKDLSDGEVSELGATIRDNFCVGEGESRRCARYVFTDREHEDFYNDALDSGWFDVAYEDADCAVLHIRDERGDPVPDNVPPQSGGDNNNAAAPDNNPDDNDNVDNDGEDNDNTDNAPGD